MVREANNLAFASAKEPYTTMNKGQLPSRNPAALAKAGARDKKPLIWMLPGPWLGPFGLPIVLVFERGIMGEILTQAFPLRSMHFT
eukprot:scaffold98906_cov22-Tisochrysis_lutea.AAC.2